MSRPISHPAFPSLLFAFFWMVLSPALASAEESGTVWHTVEIKNLGFEVSVPVIAPRYEKSLQISGSTEALSPDSGEVYVRIQNYTEEELAQGGGPWLKGEQFFFEISATVAERLDETEEASSCAAGTVKHFTSPYTGGWCTFDPTLLVAEMSITHLAWLWHDGILYRLDIDAGELDAEVPGKVFSSFCPVKNR